MSDDEWKLEQGKVIGDLKLGFRHEQIESEGNDPIKSGESFGTPHDLACIQQNGENNDESQNEYGNSVVPSELQAHLKVDLMVQEDHQKQVTYKTDNKSIW